MAEKKEEKKRPYHPPEIKTVTYDPGEKVIAGTECEAGSATPEFPECDPLACDI